MIFRRGDVPPPVLVPQEARRNELAAWVLFTTEPTDRALAGWYAADWAYCEAELLGIAATEECG